MVLRFTTANRDGDWMRRSWTDTSASGNRGGGDVDIQTLKRVLSQTLLPSDKRKRSAFKGTNVIYMLPLCSDYGRTVPASGPSAVHARLSYDGWWRPQREKHLCAMRQKSIGQQTSRLFHSFSAFIITIKFLYCSCVILSIKLLKLVPDNQSSPL